MSEISRWLTTFVLNAIWQITAITIFAFVSAKLLQRMPSRYVHRMWVSALAACLLIPMTTVLVQHASISRNDIVQRTAAATNDGGSPASDRISVKLHSQSRLVSVPPILSRTMLWMFVVLVLYRAMRLAWVARHTCRTQRFAYERQIPPRVSTIAERCSRRLSVARVPLLCSNEVSTPATVGFRRPVVLLPEIFFANDLREDDVVSALAHEFAHVRRHDFLFNLIYESVYLPLSFHPLTAFIRSRIADTRELACDEMAAQVLPSETHYASSLVRIAQSMLSRNQTQTTYALGLFDTNSLEERIMNILRTSNNGSRKWARTLRLMAVCLVGAVALGISAFSLRLGAENANDLKRFAGTWECKYKGKTFFTLKMALKDGVLGGTAVHSTRVVWVDGEIIPDTEETTNDRIFDTHPSGQELVIKIADGPNDADPISLIFKLTGKDEAEAKLIVEKQPSEPEQKKPWHFQRVSNAQ